MATSTATMVIDYAQYDVITWPTMAATDVGSAVDAAKYGEISVQAIGDATSVAMQGSNDAGTTWAALGAGATLTVTAGTSPVTRIAEHPMFIRPVATGGTVTKVIMIGRKLK